MTLMHGPLGVASSARREPPRPASATVESAIEARSANADHAPSRPAAPPQAQRQNHEPDQNVIGEVAAQTLFEASRIASILPPDIETRAIPAQTPSEPWQPPWSSFHLRDRTV